MARTFTHRILAAASLGALLTAVGCSSPETEPKAQDSAASSATKSATQKSSSQKSSSQQKASALATDGASSASSDTPTTTGKHPVGSSEQPDSVKNEQYIPATSERKASGVPVPKIPDLTRKNTDAGRIETVKYYFAAEHFVEETGRLTPMHWVLDPEWEDGNAYIKHVEKHYSAGGWIVPKQTELANFKVSKPNKHGLYTVTFDAKKRHGQLGVKKAKGGKRTIPGTIKGSDLKGDGVQGRWKMYVYYDPSSKQNYIGGWDFTDRKSFTEPKDQRDT